MQARQSKAFVQDAAQANAVSEAALEAPEADKAADEGKGLASTDALALPPPSAKTAPSQPPAQVCCPSRKCAAGALPSASALQVRCPLASALQMGHSLCICSACRHPKCPADFSFVVLKHPPFEQRLWV